MRFLAAALLGMNVLLLPETSAPSHGLIYKKADSSSDRVPLDYSRNTFDMSNYMTSWFLGEPASQLKLIQYHRRSIWDVWIQPGHVVRVHINAAVTPIIIINGRW